MRNDDHETHATMRAAVCVKAGGPGVLEIRELPVPAVRDRWSLVRVKGAGLNRSELRTRQGLLAAAVGVLIGVLAG
jgi:NADPH:quinone reductase-like Zn-dependent oxidoreductase